jgi:hypothetical protein
MATRSSRLALAIGVVLATPAAGAPFCIDVEGIPLRCLYVDPGQCQQEATRQGGRCTGNPAELTTPPGPGQFCVIEAVGAISCLYADRASCDDESVRRNTACIPATPAPQKTPPAHDPFALRRPY